MEISQLKSFVTVAAEKNITRSSELLCITQPALSTQIKALESELGILLFNRNSRGMELTENGQQLLQKAIRILDEIESFENYALALKKNPSGKISIGINASIDVLKINELNCVLAAGFPGIVIHLIQSTSREIKSLLKQRLIDFGFIFGDNSDSELSAFKLGELNLCLVVHPQLKPLVEVENYMWLENQTWIMRSEHCPFYKILKGFLQKKNINPRKMIFANQDPVVYDLIQAERGVSFILESEALKLLEKKQIMFVPHDAFKVDLSFAYSKSKLGNPNHQAILKSIKGIWNSSMIGSGK
jgi:DNA-binding transcriptional LysR family regulator